MGQNSSHRRSECVLPRGKELASATSAALMCLDEEMFSVAIKMFWF